MTTVFPKYSQKCIKKFFYKRLQLIKWFLYRPFANFELFQNTQRKHFSWSLHLLKSEILDYDCRDREKGTVSQILEILEQPFLSEQIQYVSVVQSGSRLQTIFVNSIKRELHYIRCSDNFPNFWISEHPHESVCDGVQQKSGLFSIVMFYDKK